MKAARKWMRGPGMLCLAVLFLLCETVGGSADAEKPAIVDITTRCKFYLSVRPAWEDRLFDCDARTYWQNEENGDGYIQFYKPAGAATLSLLWAKIPEGVRLFRLVLEEGWELASWFASEAAREGAAPDAFPLPEEAGMYRLYATSGRMAIAELRVHEGMVDRFFAQNGYPDSPTLADVGAPYVRPIRMHAKVSGRVKWAQERLVALGYFEGKPDGRISELTYLALLRFQRANGLYPSGAYEPTTACALQSPQAIAAWQANASGARPARIPRTSSEFVHFLRQCVGSGYVYGGTGQISSPSVRGAAARLYPEYKGLIRGYASRWDSQPVFDCNGLIMAFLEISKGELPDERRVNVNGAVFSWGLKPEPIGTMPREPGILLLQEDPAKGGSFMHIGVYAGEGRCIHARGHRYGVIMEAMPQLWTHWARPAWLEYDLVEEEETSWPPYMGAGTRVMVDSAAGGSIYLYTRPVKGNRYRTKIRLHNYRELLIEAVPEDAHYWRVVTVLDAIGRPVTGYVFARDLSPME